MPRKIEMRPITVPTDGELMTALTTVKRLETLFSDLEGSDVRKLQDAIHVLNRIVWREPPYEDLELPDEPVLELTVHDQAAR